MTGTIIFEINKCDFKWSAIIAKITLLYALNVVIKGNQGGLKTYVTKPFDIFYQITQSALEAPLLKFFFPLDVEEKSRKILWFLKALEVFFF